MKIEKIESLFNNDKEYLTIVEGITQDDVIIKTSTSPKKEEAVDSRYSFDRTNYASVYVVLKPEMVEVLKSINPGLLKCFGYSDVMREEEKSYNLHDTQSFSFKFTGIRTREKKIEKYNKVYQAFLDNVPHVTEILSTRLISKVNDYLKAQVEDINDKYVRNHVELFTSDTYEDAWTQEFTTNQELVKTQKEKKELAKQIVELNSKLSSLNNKITTTKCEITKNYLDKEELPTEVLDKINEKYDNDEAWKIYNRRRLGFSS
jgi:hypothetical protein